VHHSTPSDFDQHGNQVNLASFIGELKDSRTENIRISMRAQFSRRQKADDELFQEGALF